MKISWGFKITLLYAAFAAGIVTLVVASSRQKIDLVSKDYYEAELGFQKVIDASNNQSKLSHPVTVYANGSDVNFDFPAEFKGKIINGSVQFYSPANDAWDKKVDFKTENTTYAVQRSVLHNTRYTVKLSFAVDGKNFYQESDIQLAK